MSRRSKRVNISNGQQPQPRPPLFGDELTANMVLNRVEELLQNSATTLSRQALVSQNVLDPRRDIDTECGYPAIGSAVAIDVYRQLWEREGIATQVVQALPNECWGAPPEVWEDDDPDTDTEFEAAFKAINLPPDGNVSWHQTQDGSTIWGLCKRADILSRIGHFGVILLGFDDGKPLQEPVDGVQFITNQQVEPIYQGRKDQRRQVGWKVKRQSTSSVLPPDSPPSHQEWQSLSESITNNSVIHNRATYQPTGQQNQQGETVWAWRSESQSLPAEYLNSPLTRNEQLVQQWGGRQWQAGLAAFDSREAANGFIQNVLQDESQFVQPCTVNQRGEVAQVGPVTNARGFAPGLQTKGQPFQSVKEPQSQRSQSRDLELSSGSNGVRIGAPTSPEAVARSAGTLPPAWQNQGSPYLQGTDANYAWESIAPSAFVDSGKGSSWGKPSSGVESGVGTDQQYFGVIFGPSERFTDEPSKRDTKLLFARAYDEALVQIVRYEWNVRSPRFGRPVMYRVTMNDPREVHTGIGLPLATVFVHWSRIIHLNDDWSNAAVSNNFAVPAMRPNLNRLLDLRKVLAASAEGYWRASSPTTVLTTHPQLGGDVEIDIGAITEDMDALENSLKKHMILRGMDAKTLPPTVVDPSPHVEVLLQAIAMQLEMPMRILRGSAPGSMGGKGDADDSDERWNDKIRARQQGYCTPKIVCALVDRLIQVGVLPEPESYTVEWPDLDALSAKDQAGVAQSMTAALAQYVSSGAESIMPVEWFLSTVLGLESERVSEIMEAVDQQQEEDMYTQQQQQMGPQFDEDGNPIQPGDPGYDPTQQGQLGQIDDLSGDQDEDSSDEDNDTQFQSDEDDVEDNGQQEEEENSDESAH